MNRLGLQHTTYNLGDLGNTVGDLLLDGRTNETAFAFSTRKLRRTYTGSSLRIRRSSDNAEQDIGFNANNELDTAAISSFVGANSAFVVTWYDQGIGGHHVTQATTTLQPRIVLNGTLQTGANGKPGMFFDGADYLVRTTHDVNANSWTAVTTFHVFAMRLNMAADTGHGCIAHIGRHDSNVYWTMGAVTSTLTGETVAFLSNNNNVRIGASEANYDLSGSQYVVEDWQATSGGFELFSNNVQRTFDLFDGGASAATHLTPDVHATDYDAVGLAIGAMAWNASTNFHVDGVVQEVIHMKEASDRAKFRNNINEYYALY